MTRQKENRITGFIIIGMIAAMFWLMCNAPALAQSNPLGVTTEYVFTPDSGAKMIGRFKHTGKYTVEMDVRADYSFARKKYSIVYTYGGTSVSFCYPNLVWNTANDNWTVKLDGVYGWSMLADRNWHHITFRSKQGRIEFLIDSIVVASRGVVGETPTDAPLYLSTPTYTGPTVNGKDTFHLDDNCYSFSGAIRNVTFNADFITSPNEKQQPVGVLDPLEFHPLYKPGSYLYIGVPSFMQQVKSFPLPR